MFDTHEAMRARERATDALEGEVAELCGLLNVAHGRLAVLVAAALEQGWWHQWGIHSPAHWLAWRTGMSPAHAGQVVKVAERSAELPVAFAAFVAGELSLDQCYEIARFVPAEFDAGVTELARLCTVQQLRRVLPRYAFADDLAEARKARAAAAPEPADEDPADEGAAAPGPSPVTERRELTMGTDDQGWYISGRLPFDEGAVVERALRASRDERYRVAVEGLPPKAPRPQLGLVHGLLGLAESALAAGQVEHPGADRFTIFAHLELGPTGADQLALHLGPRLPDHLMALRSCDATLRPVWEREGSPVSVGRDHRIVPPRVRRLIEHRHDGCAVPGCGRRHGLDIHHLVHWQHGGRTDTGNLVALCHTHHRAHHLGHLDISGNPDEPDGLTFRDRHGRTLNRTGRPRVPTPGDPIGVAAAAGIEPGRYQHPTGEPLRTDAVSFHADVDRGGAPPGRPAAA